MRPALASFLPFLEPGVEVGLVREETRVPRLLPVVTGRNVRSCI